MEIAIGENPHHHLFRYLGAILLASVFALIVPNASDGQTLPHFLRDYRADTSCGDGCMRVRAFADGSIKDALQDGTDLDGSGSMGLEFGLEELVVKGYLSISATVDSISSNFGTTLLNPTLGSEGPVAVLEIAWPYALGPGKLWGLGGYLAMSESEWVLPEDLRSDTSLPTEVNSSVLSWGVYTFHPITGATANERNEVGLTVGIGLAGRHLAGDLRNETTFHEAVLGATDSDDYWGAEGFLALNINQVTGFVHAYYFRGAEVSGIRGVNAMFGVTVRGSLFELDFTRDVEESTTDTSGGAVP